MDSDVMDTFGPKSDISTAAPFPLLAMELVLHIFEAASSDFRTCRSLVCISRTVHKMLTPMLYRTVSFVTGVEEHLFLLHRTLLNSNNGLILATSIRRLSVVGYDGHMVAEIITVCTSLEKLAVGSLCDTLDNYPIGLSCPAPRSIASVYLRSLPSRHPLLRNVSHLSLLAEPDDNLTMILPEGNIHVLKESIPFLTHLSIAIDKDEDDIDLIARMHSVLSSLSYLTTVLVPYDEDSSSDSHWGNFWCTLSTIEDLKVHVANRMFILGSERSLLALWDDEEMGGKYRDPGDMVKEVYVEID